MTSFHRLFILICFLIFQTPLANGQLEYISGIIEDLKEDRRGPYKDIKWFCEDGSVRAARDPCPGDMEGVQHARYKDNVLELRRKHHVYLDQILIETNKTDFWDPENNHSRLKQYQLNNFLVNADDGWINRQARMYRGAKQIEDEQKWGLEFLNWLVADNDRLNKNFLLIRLAFRDIPHREDNPVSQRIRGYSKQLAEIDNSFMDLRTKIHNTPSMDDIKSVEKWIDKNDPKGTAAEYAHTLVDDMKEWYKPFDPAEISRYERYLPEGSVLRNELVHYSELLEGLNPEYKALRACELLKVIRENIFDTQWTVARVKLIDLSNDLEDMILQTYSVPEEPELKVIRDHICYFVEGLYGAGYLENWEYRQIKPEIDWLQGYKVNVASLEEYRFAVNKVLVWCTQSVQSLYDEVVALYYPFEPLVYGMVDDKIRSSIILPFGLIAEEFGELFSTMKEPDAHVLGKDIKSGVKGLNPGLAKAELVVVEQLTEDFDFDRRKIYAFDQPPADMKPVAGIINVKEGNPISHIQLLARSLGIPNAQVSQEILQSLKKYEGKEIFYAVSPKGTIRIVEGDEMKGEEQKLVEEKERNKEKIRISTDQLHLEKDSLLDLSRVDASFSGKWCGPKAANLGQLKKMFPEHVVDGIVVPFGVFKDHMEQNIPGINESYWSYLKRIFRNEQQLLAQGVHPVEVECITLQELELLRGHIEEMPLKPGFIRQLENKFRTILGQSLGNIPVFLRSDTNMEDLPEFTGAGLNLTLFNVVDRQEILDGIKKVWASPYTERSYQWRQQYLINPEDVYPSILIIPSVNVDRSGVIVTTGVSRGGEKDISISFSRGVGGAVEGQSAESWLLRENGYWELISPGRENKYRTIPPSGGSVFEYTTFEESVLTGKMLNDLAEITRKISVKMKEEGGMEGPYDIELGIKDGEIWLFQVRPFVENKDADRSQYLKSLDPEIDNKYVSLDE